MILFKRRDIGWKEIREEFTRWELRTPWFGVLLHRMNAPIEHKYFHDHPWSFVSVVLTGGYWEAYRGLSGSYIAEWRGPGSIRFRRAEFAHKTTTYRNGPSWSLCFTGPKRREWCGDIL